MTELTAESVLVRNPDAAFRIIEDAAVIVMPRDARILNLNAVGTRVWALLDGRTVAQIAEAIAAEFDVTEREALDDVLAFLETLRERGMIEERDAG